MDSKLPDYLSGFQHPDVESIATIRGVLLQALQTYALTHGFKQLMPVLTSPITDPLNHSVYPAMLNYEGRSLKLTASMIFHKQLAVTARGHEKIFVIAPNIRLEKKELKDSDNHLIEFSQFDFEVRHASMNEVMHFINGLINQIIREIKQHCPGPLSQLDRQLPECSVFPIYTSSDARKLYGDDFEGTLSALSKTPFFITDFKREFYDRETPGLQGTYNNFDLFYPDGFGEALSGGEREYQHDRIIDRMLETSVDATAFSDYLEVARGGGLYPSAGAGIGIERLLKFICGKRQIREVGLFDRRPGIDFTF